VQSRSVGQQVPQPKQSCIHVIRSEGIRSRHLVERRVRGVVAERWFANGEEGSTCRG
jgi:hypothetical protein